MTSKKMSITEQLRVELRSLIEEYSCIEREFLDEYYRSEVNPQASDDELTSHRDRYRKIDNRSPERIVPYVKYMKEKHCWAGSKVSSENKVKDINTAAAWELLVEFKSRIATVCLPSSSGRDDAALKSLAIVFEAWRTICKKHGHQCAAFFDYSKSFLDEKLRPFTTKWHAKVSPSCFENQEFRSELEGLQVEIKQFCQSLEERFSLAGS